MFPAARYPDPITHDLVTPCGTTVPLPAGPDAQLTLIEGLPAAHVTHGAACTGVIAVGIAHPPAPAPVPILKGGMTTWVGGFPIGRWAPSGDVAGCGVFLGNLSMAASRTTLVGDLGGAPTATVTFNADGTVTIAWGSMTINGSPADAATFVGMLTNQMGRTAAGRGHLLRVVNDTTHPTTYNVGRNQPGVFVDSFNSNDVDLTDIEAYPEGPLAGHPNAATQGEHVTHFVVERNDNANNGAGLADPFTPAHATGTAAHNDVRRELGQSPELSATGTPRDAAGNRQSHFNYADGTRTTTHLDRNNNITRIDHP
jgi:hypothetical protein